MANEVLTLTIDGKAISGLAGETILEVARENDITIPSLCYIDGLCSIGACRLCLVELAGSPRLFPACTTRIEEGMSVTTQSPALLEHRRMIVSLLFSERNHICAVCVSNGHCDLQNMAITLGLTHSLTPYLYPKMEVDASHPLFIMDHNRCILCSACVRVCDEIEGANTKDVSGRGKDARIITDAMQSWGESESCTSCGKCVQVCPTGALSEKGKSVSEQIKKRSFLDNYRENRGGGL